MSLEQPLVPPAAYYYLRSGWWGGARIVAVPPDDPPSNRNQETSPLISNDSEPSCNPFTTMCEKLGCGSGTDGWIGSYFASDPPSTSPTHFIQRKGATTFTLVEGSGDQSKSRDAEGSIDFQIEACFGTTSTFIRTNDPSRRALLWKADGLNPWWSTQRTLDDFENVRYSCHTEFCSESITLTRLSDNTVVARFTRARFKFTWGLIGMLQILEPVPEELLDLILCAIYAKFLLDEGRRRSSNR